MFITLFLYFLFQSAATLAPVVIPIVVFLVAVGAAYGFSLNDSRTASLIGALATLYAAIGPLISSYTSLPGWLRTLLIIAGIAATALNERITGGSSKVTVADARVNEARSSAL